MSVLSITTLKQNIAEYKLLIQSGAITPDFEGKMLEDITDTLNALISKTSDLIYQNAVATVGDLTTTYPTPSVGWASMVTGLGIFAWNGTEWANTGLKAFPEDVVVKAEMDSKVDVVSGRNKVDISKSTNGKFFWEGSNTTGDDSNKSITNYIPVTGNLISSWDGSDGMGNNVYNANRVWLRSFTGNQYTHQEGDAYVRFTYDNRYNLMINEGTVKFQYEAYTSTYTTDSKIKDLVINLNKKLGKDIGLNKANISEATSSRFIWSWGEINVTDAPAERSITGYIPVTGNLISNQNVLSGTGNNVYDADLNYLRTFTIPQYTYQEGDGYVVYTFDNRHDLMINEGTVSKTYEAYTETATIDTKIASIVEQTGIVVETVIEVSPDYNSGTEGWGVSKFASIIAAHSSITDNSKNNRYKIKVVKAGTYNEWESVWPGIDGDSTSDVSYQGIIVKDYVSFESGDTDHPEDYILEWDGHSGYSSGYVMSTDQAMRKCIFHITGSHTTINGFTFRNKNTRYCVHPESASTGAGNEWTLKNCVFEWNGRPDCSEAGGTSVGIGISSGETGNIINCKFTGTVQGGIGGHNNGWDESQGEKPFLVPGAILNIENCDFGGNLIYMKSYIIDAGVFDVMNLKNCVNISAAAFGFENGQTIQNWRATVQACKIDSDLLLK